MYTQTVFPVLYAPLSSGHSSPFLNATSPSVQLQDKQNKLLRPQSLNLHDLTTQETWGSSIHYPLVGVATAHWTRLQTMVSLSKKYIHIKIKNTEIPSHSGSPKSTAENQLWGGPITDTPKAMRKSGQEKCGYFGSCAHCVRIKVKY